MEMTTTGRNLASYLPHALIVWWAASNFLFSNRFEYFSIANVGQFYMAVFLGAVVTTFTVQKAFPKYKKSILISSYMALFVMFLTPSLREFLDQYIRYRYTLLIAFLIAASLSYLAIKTVGKNKFILPFSFFFLFLSAIPTGQHLYFLFYSQAQNSLNEVVFKGPAVRKPNVYFFILDAYMRSDILKQNLDFDNSQFMSFLSQRNFFNAEGSFVAYPTTVYSMTTTFRMKHVTEFEPDIWSQRFKSDTFKNFSALGYSLHFMSQSRGVVPCPENITCYKTVPKSDFLYIGRLGTTLIKTIPLLEDLLLATVPERFVYELNNISDLHDTILKFDPKGPAFFYAHILMPHSPYTLDAECKPVDIKSSGDFTSFRWNIRHRYLDFLKCGNRQVRKMIDALIAKDKDAIIILQGDHGAYFTNNRYSGTDDAPEPGPEPWRKAAMDGAYANLNVLRVPQPCRSTLYPTMSPVNTFRMVFACITDIEPTYLSDKSFWIDYDRKDLKLIRDNGKWLF